MANTDIDYLLAGISHESASVEALPGLLAMFGGGFRTPLETASKALPKSARDACVDWLRVNRADLHAKLLLPENYEDWSNFNTYSDLLLFEEDLGYLTAAVVIFLEAPGSIAELGAFSQIDSLKDRLVIVVTDDRHPKKSFISLGPLRQLEERDSESVCVIPPGEPINLVDHISVVVNAIDGKISRIKPRKAFDANEKQHQFALALDVITLLEVVTFGDVKQAFEHFKIQANETRIKQILFTLTASKLVQRQRYGGVEYYLPKNRGEKLIDYQGKNSSEKFNRIRVQAKILQNRDPADTRTKALQRVFPQGEQ